MLKGARDFQGRPWLCGRSHTNAAGKRGLTTSRPFSLREPGALETSPAHAWEKGIPQSDSRMIFPPSETVLYARAWESMGFSVRMEKNTCFLHINLSSAFTKQ